MKTPFVIVIRSSVIKFILPLTCGVISHFLVSSASALQQKVPSVQLPIAQAAGTSGELERIIGTLTWWVTILGIFSTVVITASAINIISQIYQARKVGENIKTDLISQMEKEILALKETYKLAALKSPDEILRDARRDYEPLIEVIRKGAESRLDDLNSRINKITDDTRSMNEALYRLQSDYRTGTASPPPKDIAVQDGTQKKPSAS